MLSKFVASLVGMAFAFSAAPLQAQSSIAPASTSELVLGGQETCRELRERLKDRRKQGIQWLIGDEFRLYNRAVDTTPGHVIGRQFTMVQCYGAYQDTNRVFIAEENFEFCGWVNRDDLLDEHHRDYSKGIGVVRTRNACRIPRAMLFSKLCAEAPRGLFGSKDSDICKGIPEGLRAKGVLTGATHTGKTPRHPFYATPDRQEVRDSKAFFSVLEIHDIETFSIDDEREGAMLLVGDGDGRIFGWIDAAALRLWPTRLGLFFDENARGVIFSDRRSAIHHFRHGELTPDVRSQGSEAVRQHVHGGNPLVSYPIVRTLPPSSADDRGEEDPAVHEIVFLGQTGKGSTADLIQQARISRRITNLHRINIMVVMDTTESMLDYLPAVTSGVAQFIEQFGAESQNREGRYPDVRLAAYAYSDFRSAKRTGIGDPIKIKQLMPPVDISLGFDVTSQLDAISTHAGLSDDAGQFREASLEAVIALAGRFEKDEDWFRDGPRIIVHIADHGSRDGLDLSAIDRYLVDSRVIYYPIIVTTNDVTDDPGDNEVKQRRRKKAREAAEAQAFELLRNNLTDAKTSDLPRIDFSEGSEVSTEVVRKSLQTTFDEILDVMPQLRTRLLGDIASAPDRALDSASARITYDERLIANYGLDNIDKKVIAVAGQAFAPLELKEQGAVTEVDWVYTVALEEDQFSALRELHLDLCQFVGHPGKVKDMRKLVISLLQAFSGDKVDTNDDATAIFRDLRQIKGVNKGGLLSHPPMQLLEKIDSTVPEIVNELRRDVCWTSYHLNNVVATSYARQGDVVWHGDGFGLRADAQITKRIYKYHPIVGPELYYLPAWYFLVPPPQKKEDRHGCRGFKTDC